MSNLNSNQIIQPNQPTLAKASLIHKIFNKKNMIIFVIVIIVSIVIYHAYRNLDMPERSTKDILIEDELLANAPKAIPDCEVSDPITGVSFSCSFWINIHNFYDNHLFWKHVFHKGTPIDSFETVLEYRDWEVLVSEMSKQCPGLWIDPNTNLLRLALTTQIKREYKYPSHPDVVTTMPQIEYKPDNVLKNTIEFCDLPNIAINQLTHVAFVVYPGMVEIYLEGQQAKTCNLLGEPQFNKGAFYFNYQKSYNGKILDFRYFPYKLKRTDIEELYNTKPKNDN